jgi:hypothetical protein
MRAAKLAGGEDGQVEILCKFKFKVSVYRQTICDMEKTIATPVHLKLKHTTW